MRHLILFVCSLGTSTLALCQPPSLQWGITDTRTLPHACAVFQDAGLEDGQQIYFIAFDPQRWVAGHIVQKRSEACRAESVLAGTAYAVQLDEPDGVFQELGVSVAGSASRPANNGGQVLLENSAGGEAITFRRCTSNEGIHFFALQGSQQLWHEYYYVPYGLEPTCMESDFEQEQR